MDHFSAPSSPGRPLKFSFDVLLPTTDPRSLIAIFRSCLTDDVAEQVAQLVMEFQRRIPARISPWHIYVNTVTGNVSATPKGGASENIFAALPSKLVPSSDDPERYALGLPSSMA